MSYQALSGIAAALATDEPTLLDFRKKGWIQAVEKHSTIYLSADQSYRARYILHLRRAKRLNDEQIQLVLSMQRPPYSSAEVDQILKHPARKPTASA